MGTSGYDRSSGTAVIMLIYATFALRLLMSYRDQLHGILEQGRRNWSTAVPPTAENGKNE